LEVRVGTVQVDPAALEAVAATLAGQGAEIRAALDGLAASAAGAAPATGAFGAPEAYAEMWSAWVRDIGTLADALGELGQRVRDAAAAYRATDEHAAP
jgi:WXG100 family type VII secretion target